MEWGGWRDEKSGCYAAYATDMRKRLTICLLSLVSAVSAAPEVTTAELKPDTAKAANGLVRSLVAREPLLKNPVSVSVDVDGKIYVTETTRRKAADLDIRSFRQWIPQDLSHTSIEDKRAFFRSELVPENKQYAKKIKDQNKDGVVDWRDLTVLSEKIHLLEDADGDGVMDRSTLFADEFQTEVTGIAAGVLAWRGDVYATIAPDVWKLRDTNGDGESDQRESIAHGFGLHIAYAGHDMHGLTFGPDGRLYWSIGDKGTNVMSQEGVRWKYPHEGAVLRCYPDGSGFEVFAHGLRNVQEIAFDAYGNLFGVDNDADFGGEKERFVYIVEGSDSGWRSYYQYRGKDYNPWMDEKMAVPHCNEQLAYYTPAMSNSVDGPAGLAYNPGTALNERYRDAFFLTQFPAGKISAFRVKPDGAGFQMVDFHDVMKGPATVGTSFGPDGALYFTDWGGGWTLNNKGAIWKLDDPKEAQSEERREVAAMLREGPAQVSQGDLAERLAHADQRVRLDAQWELVRRKQVALFDQIALNPDAPQLARIHAIWGLAQLQVERPETMTKLAQDEDVEIRAQAGRWAGELGSAPAGLLVKLMSDGSPRVAHLAAIAAGKISQSEALPAAIELLEKSPADDTVLRHSVIYALAGSANAEQLADLASHASRHVRRGAVVALRRQQAPEVVAFLNDSEAAVVTEAVAAIYDDWMIEAALPAAAAVLERGDELTEAAARRSMAANRRVGDVAAAKRLANYAVEASHPEVLRVFAIELIGSWAERVKLDPADGRAIALEPKERASALAAARVVATTLGDDASKALVSASNQMAKKLGLELDLNALAKRARERSIDEEARVESLKTLGQIGDKVAITTARALLEDASPALRATAAGVLAADDPNAVMNYLQTTGLRSDHLPEAQRSVRLLAELKHSDASDMMLSMLELVANGNGPGGLHLDIFRAAESMSEKHPETAKKLDSLREDLAKKKPLGTFQLALEGGDQARGERVFQTHLSAQCAQCHRVGDEGSDVGPPLTNAGRHSRAYLLESLIHPQAVVTPGYGFTTVTMENGKVLTGTLESENDEAIKIATADGKTHILALEDVAERTDPISTMPPMRETLTLEELRNLVAYLSGLKAGDG